MQICEKSAENWQAITEKQVLKINGARSYGNKERNKLNKLNFTKNDHISQFWVVWV